MKCLFIGDVHIKHCNIANVDCLASTAEKVNNVDVVVVAGDVLDSHERIDTQLMNRAFDLVQRLRAIAKVVILVGNHDFINNQQFQTKNHWMNGMKEWSDVVVVDRATAIGSCVFVPFVPPGRFVEALDTLSIDWRRDASVIFAHQEFSGCKMGAIVSTIGDFWDPVWPTVISGHIHDRQRPHPNVHYPGAAFTECAIFVLDTNRPNDGHARIPLADVKMKKSVNIKANEVTKAATLLIDGTDKVTIGGSNAQIKAFQSMSVYRKLKNKGIKIVFKPDEEKRAEKVSVNRFAEILDRLILTENDAELADDYATLLRQPLIK